MKNRSDYTPASQLAISEFTAMYNFLIRIYKLRYISNALVSGSRMHIWK